jgi:DNA-binding PadR family transcriptional regulator
MQYTKFVQSKKFMSLAYALLTSLLVDGAKSGYDLVKLFDQQISCYWIATHQQVYKELREMEQKGWVRSERISQANRPNKNLYDITTLGREALTAWVMQPSQPTPIREELMPKLKAGFLVPREVLIAEIQRRQIMHQEQLEILQNMEQQYFPEVGSKPLRSLSYEARLYHLGLRRGIRYQTEWVEWCEEAIAAIGEYEESD